MKDLKGFESLYSITESGEVYSKDKVCYNPRYGNYIRKGKKLKITKVRGYLTCVINCKQVGLHTLLYENFIGEIPTGYVVHHINENKLDNRLNNLVCMSREEHIKHHNNNGKIYGNRKSDLPNEKINEIIRLYKDGLSNRKIANIVGCGKSTVQRICKIHSERVIEWVN